MSKPWVRSENVSLVSEVDGCYTQLFLVDSACTPRCFKEARSVQSHFEIWTSTDKKSAARRLLCPFPLKLDPYQGWLKDEKYETKRLWKKVKWSFACFSWGENIFSFTAWMRMTVDDIMAGSRLTATWGRINSMTIVGKLPKWIRTKHFVKKKKTCTKCGPIQLNALNKIQRNRSLSRYI